jgi:GDSL-like lipase/acylhydrolase family protein
VRRILALLLAVLCAAVLASVSFTAPAEAMTPRPAATAERGHPRALFFGDSYFVGGGCSPDAKQDMAYLAGTELGYRPTVRGAGGTGFVAANPEYDLPPYLGQIHDGAFDLRNPQLVVVAGGSNDVGLPLDEVKKNAKKILRIARQRFPRALLVLVGPMDPYGGYADSIPIRDVLHVVAKQLDVPFIDDMTWLQSHPDWLCDDYVHPTYAAEVPLGQRLAKALRKLGA